MKKILIIGSNSFIGSATADHLEKNGFACTRTSRKSSVNGLALDIEDEESIRKFAAQQRVIFDGIIFFQGINPAINTKNTTPVHFSRMLSVNLTGPAMVMKHMHTRLSDGAMILLFSSVAATKGSYDPAYAAAKAGLLGLMQSFANEFPAQRFNIISPGLVEDSPVFAAMTEDFREKHAERMGNRFITKENISSMVLELLTNESVSRAVINMDGGFKN